jgi:hypothetical protein
MKKHQNFQQLLKKLTKKKEDCVVLESEKRFSGKWENSGNGLLCKGKFLWKNVNKSEKSCQNLLRHEAATFCRRRSQAAIFDRSERSSVYRGTVGFDISRFSSQKMPKK